MRLATGMIASVSVSGCGWSGLFTRVRPLSCPSQYRRRGGRRRYVRRRSSLEVYRIADDRARHAVAASAPAAQFGTNDGDDLDALLAQQRIGVRIAVIGVHDARRRAHQV